LFREWLQRYRGKAIFVPEDKDMHSMSAMLKTLADMQISRDQVLLQCFSLEPLQLAVAAGYQCVFLNGTATSIAAVQAAKVGWVALPLTTPEATVKQWIDSGFKVLLWVVNRRFERDAWLARGLKGFFSDDPTYLHETKALATRDQFSTGNWAPGMLGNSGDVIVDSRGAFFSGGYWGYATTKAGYLGCLQGYLCPIKPADSGRVFDISLKITFDASLSQDAAHYVSLFLGVDDRPFQDMNESSSGYHLIFRKNGAVVMQKKAAGFKAEDLQASSSAPIADGEEVQYRISVTESAITVVRLNKDGSNGVTTTARDNAFTTMYLHLGRNGLACRFRHIQVS
jgi:hypothetical protein